MVMVVVVSGAAVTYRKRTQERLSKDMEDNLGPLERFLKDIQKFSEI